jgi:C_GCAxxG_C_C family probable redox protein
MRKEIAKNYFLGSFNCAQSVLVSFSDIINIDEKELLKLASSFGGGMGKMQLTCGAVSGALMVLGHFFGKEDKDDRKALEKNYQLVREFMEKFIEEFGSENCKSLIKCDLSTDEGRKYFVENKIGSTFCVDLVTKSIEILENILKKEGVIS